MPILLADVSTRTDVLTIAMIWMNKRNRAVETFLPRIWLMAADSLRVHSSMTRCRFSFMKSMNALSGFLTYSRRRSAGD